jgi:hypothetical protein
MVVREVSRDRSRATIECVMLDEEKEARNHVLLASAHRDRSFNQTTEDRYGCEEEDGCNAEEATCEEGESRPRCSAQEGEASSQEEVRMSEMARVQSLR